MKKWVELACKSTNVEVCSQLAHRHYIVEQCRIVHSADNDSFMADDAVKDR